MSRSATPTSAGLAENEALLRWLLERCRGVILLLLVRRYKHYLITPLMILGGVLVFLPDFVADGHFSRAGHAVGLALSAFSAGRVVAAAAADRIRPCGVERYRSSGRRICDADLDQHHHLAVICSGVEVTAGREIDLNQELARLRRGQRGRGSERQPPGYTIITMSVLASRLGANSRWAGVVDSGR